MKSSFFGEQLNASFHALGMYCIYESQRNEMAVPLSRITFSLLWLCNDTISFSHIDFASTEWFYFSGESWMRSSIVLIFGNGFLLLAYSCSDTWNWLFFNRCIKQWECCFQFYCFRFQQFFFDWIAANEATHIRTVSKMGKERLHCDKIAIFPFLISLLRDGNFN